VLEADIPARSSVFALSRFRSPLSASARSREGATKARNSESAHRPGSRASRQPQDQWNFLGARGRNSGTEQCFGPFAVSQSSVGIGAIEGGGHESAKRRERASPRDAGTPVPTRSMEFLGAGGRDPCTERCFRPFAVSQSFAGVGAIEGGGHESAKQRKRASPRDAGTPAPARSLGFLGCSRPAIRHGAVLSPFRGFAATCRRRRDRGRGPRKRETAKARIAPGRGHPGTHRINGISWGLEAGILARSSVFALSRFRSPLSASARSREGATKARNGESAHRPGTRASRHPQDQWHFLGARGRHPSTER
jgi:hypothetical protein